MTENLVPALDKASEIAALVGAARGPIGIIAKIASLALKAGSALAEAGKDPVIEIQRILSASPEVAKIHDEWEAHIATWEAHLTPRARDSGEGLYDDDED